MMTSACKLPLGHWMLYAGFVIFVSAIRNMAILTAAGELIFTILLEEHFSPSALLSRVAIHDN